MEEKSQVRFTWKEDFGGILIEYESHEVKKVRLMFTLEMESTQMN